MEVVPNLSGTVLVGTLSLQEMLKIISGGAYGKSRSVFFLKSSAEYRTLCPE